jgi:hypothetical protein
MFSNGDSYSPVGNFLLGPGDAAPVGRLFWFRKIAASFPLESTMLAALRFGARPVPVTSITMAKSSRLMDEEGECLLGQILCVFPLVLWRLAINGHEL